MLTPSSNTVVEPVTSEIVRSLADVTAHFSRFTVTEISLKTQALDQFTMEPFMHAAELLAHARMHSIAWNGTSAAWKGFDQDDILCQTIGTRFGVPATASMKALNVILAQTNVQRFGLVTPYTSDVQAKIINNYHDAGFIVCDERHSGIAENFAFSQIAVDTIAGMVREVASSRPDAIMIVCTNLNSAGVVESLEDELGIPIYDSTSAVVWHSLKLCGRDTSSIRGYGSLFQSVITV